MNKILINGAGRGCLNLTKTAKKMGLYVVVTGMDGPCIPLADRAYREVHPGHPEEVLEVAKAENVDAVVTCCNDMGLASVGYCCDQLHLTGLSYEAAKISSDKLLMKERLCDKHVRTAKFKKVYNLNDLEQALEELQLPVIVKATDLQGSRGITIVNNKEELGDAFHEAMALTHKDYCIVEEFIVGTEFGAQAFVFNGEVLFVLPHGDETFMCKTAVPIGHYMPYKMNKELADDVQEQARNAIKALGLNNCAVNIDFIERDNKAYIIELTGRGGANGLTDITGLYYGINYYEMIIQTAIGGDPRLIFSKRLNTPLAVKSEMIRSSKSGIISSLRIPQLENAKLNMFVKAGDRIRLFTNCNDAIGELFVSAKTLRDCESIARNAINDTIINLI